MSEMTGDPGQNDALAAEYVLGTLDFDERRQAQALLGSDENFAAKVKVWERRLGELHLMVEPVEPDGRIWERIRVKIPQAQPSPEIKPTEPEPEPPKEATSMPSTLAPSTPALSPPSPSPLAPSPPAPSTVMPSTLEGAPSSPDKAPAGISDATTAATTSATTIPSDAARVRSETSATPKPVAPVLSLAPAPPTAAPPVLTAGVTRAPPVERQVEAEASTAALVAKMGRRLGRWRAFAVLMTLVVLAAGALVASWRFVPERVPPLLQPVELMRFVGVSIGAGPPPRPPAPPESQFDE